MKILNISVYLKKFKINVLKKIYAWILELYSDKINDHLKICKSTNIAHVRTHVCVTYTVLHVVLVHWISCDSEKFVI